MSIFTRIFGELSQIFVAANLNDVSVYLKPAETHIDLMIMSFIPDACQTKLYRSGETAGRIDLIK